MVLGGEKSISALLSALVKKQTDGIVHFAMFF
jgi:hypothetical protein